MNIVWISLIFFPLFYYSNAFYLFLWPKYLLIGIGSLLCLIYFLTKSKGRFTFSLSWVYFLFTLLILRALYTPFPLYSLFFALFFLLFMVWIDFVYFFKEYTKINLKFLFFLWLIITQIYSLIIIGWYFKLPFIKGIVGKFLHLKLTNTIFVGNPNFGAQFLGFSLIVFIVRFFYNQKKQNFILITFRVFPLFLLFLGMIFLQTRASLISVILSLFLFIVARIFCIKNVKQRYFTLLLLVLILLFLLVALFYFDVKSFLPAKVQKIFTPKQFLKQMQMRLFLWKVALNMGLSNPLFGIGPGMLRVKLGDYVRKLHEQEKFPIKSFLFNKNYIPLCPTNVHNDFLEFWAEGGIILLLFFIFYFYFLYNIIEKRKFIKFVPFIFIILNSFFSFPLHLPIVFPFLNLYLISILDIEAFKELSKKGNIFFFSSIFAKLKMFKWWKTLERLVIFSFVTIFFALSINFFLSDVYLNIGIRERNIENLEIAVKLNPVNPDGWMYLYNLSLHNSLPAQKKIFYLKNFLILAESPKYRYYFALLLEKQGDWKDALNNLFIAKNLLEKNSSLYPTILAEIGYCYYKLGNIEEALSFMKNALSFCNTRNMELRIRLLINLSGVYYKLKEYKHSYESALKAKMFIERLPKKEFNLYKKDYLFIIDFLNKINKYPSDSDINIE